jgi:hypothetical protein
MIETRLTHVDIPVRVSLLDANLLNEHSDPVIRIEVPRFSMLMDLEMYEQLSQDPAAMGAFIRGKISASFRADGSKWPHPDVLRAAQTDR